MAGTQLDTDLYLFQCVYGVTDSEEQISSLISICSVNEHTQKKGTESLVLGAQGKAGYVFLSSLDLRFMKQENYKTMAEEKKKEMTNQYFG